MMRKRQTTSIRVLCLLALVLSVTVCGCKSESSAPDTSDVIVIEDVEPANVCLPAGTGPPFKVAERADLRWKRVSALSRDLLGALALDESACAELGFSEGCFKEVHRVALGGNDPMLNAMYESIPEPRMTSALAFDRVVVATCGRRVDKDYTSALAGDEAVVFTHLDWTKAAVDPTDPGLGEQVTALYRRLLGRDPIAAEIELLLTLAEPLNGTAITTREFAKTLCYTIATTTEAVLN